MVLRLLVLLACTQLALGQVVQQQTCTDTCHVASDGDCDDGGSGFEFSACTLGTDCADCGPRGHRSDMWVRVLVRGAGWNSTIHSAPPPAAPPVGAPECISRCDNTCQHGSDADCDDGGPGSEYAACALGTDCDDCGPTRGAVTYARQHETSDTTGYLCEFVGSISNRQESIVDVRMPLGSTTCPSSTPLKPRPLTRHAGSTRAGDRPPNA